MRRTPRNIARHELVGLEAKVLDSSNPCQRGIKGRIVYETMHTVVLEGSEGRKVVPKRGAKILLTLPSGERVVVEGSVLVGRPEDRLKRRYRDW